MVFAVELVRFRFHNSPTHCFSPSFQCTDTPRGALRGNGRGAAPRGAGRGSWATPSSRPTQASGIESVATSTPSAWSLGPPASCGLPGAANPESFSPAEPAPAELVELEPKQASDFETEVPVHSLDQVTTDGALIRDALTPPESIPLRYTPEPAKRPTGRLIQPGTKMSWAQIARSASSHLPYHQYLLDNILSLIDLPSLPNLNLLLRLSPPHPKHHVPPALPPKLIFRVRPTQPVSMVWNQCRLQRASGLLSSHS